MACKDVESYIASTRATWTGDFRAMLGSIRVPALVVYGENDAIAPAALSQEIARGIPGARLEAIAGAGHVANADAPERFNDLLRTFRERDAIACAPAYTFARRSRTKPTRVTPNSFARLTARLLGAETAQTMGIPATTLF